MAYRTIRVDVDDGVATLTLNRPEKKNAMNPLLHDEVTDALEALRYDAGALVLVITGAGDAFSAGMDLKEFFIELKDKPDEYDRVTRVSVEWRGRTIRHFPKPTIAMVNGHCYGGAFTIVEACDLAVAADEARFALSEINFKMFPGGSVSKSMGNLLRPRDYLWYAMTGRPFDGRTAAEIGFVNFSVPLAELRETVMGAARDIAAKDPSALRATKEAYRHSLGMDWDTAMNYASAMEGAAHAAPGRFLPARRGSAIFWTRNTVRGSAGTSRSSRDRAPRRRSALGRDVMASCSESTIDYKGGKVFLRRGGSGRTLLFLHGAGGIPAWLPYLDRLSDRFDVIAPDHPTFGQSDEPGWVEKVDDLAYFYLDFIREHGLENVHLVGQSLGGWIALELAVRSTHSLASLTLVGAAGIRIKGEPAADLFIMDDEELARALFQVGRLGQPDAGAGADRGTAGHHHQEQGRHRPPRLAAAAVQPGAAQVAAPDRRADACDLGRFRPHHPALPMPANSAS